MKRVTFKNGLWVEYDSTNLIPKIIDTHWKASKLLGKFVLNPHEDEVGNVLKLGNNQDDKNWICSDFIDSTKYLP